MDRKSTAKLTAGLFLLFLMFSVCNSAQSILLSDYIAHYDLEAGKQGVIGAWQSLGSLVMLLILGALLRRVGKPGIVILCAVLLPVSIALMGAAPPFPIFCVGFLLLGFAFTTSDATACSWMVDIHQEASARYNSWLRAAYGLGGLVGPLLFTALTARGLRWNAVLLVTAGIAGAATAAFLLMTAGAGRRYARPAAASSIGNRIDLDTIRRFIARPENRVMAFCAILYGAHQTGTIWIQRYADLALNAPAYGTAAFAAFWFCVGVSRLLLPRFTRSQLKNILLGSALAGIILTAALLLKSPLALAVAAGTAGLIEGACQPFLYDLCCRTESREGGCGSATAGMLMLLFANVGCAATALSMGALFDGVSPIAGMLAITLSPVLIACCIAPLYLRSIRAAASPA